jgi:hypothetical protein
MRFINPLTHNGNYVYHLLQQSNFCIYELFYDSQYKHGLFPQIALTS